jgi:uncharacterized protein
VLTTTGSGVILDVRVIPRAKKTTICGVRDNALVVRLAAPPVEGAANDALIDLLARLLRRPRRSIQLLSGERGRHKRVAIDGVTADVVRERLL